MIKKMRLYQKKDPLTRAERLKIALRAILAKEPDRGVASQSVKAKDR